MEVGRTLWQQHVGASPEHLGVAEAAQWPAPPPHSSTQKEVSQSHVLDCSLPDRFQHQASLASVKGIEVLLLGEL